MKTATLPAGKSTDPSIAASERALMEFAKEWQNQQGTFLLQHYWKLGVKLKAHQQLLKSVLQLDRVNSSVIGKIAALIHKSPAFVNKVLQLAVVYSKTDIGRLVTLRTKLGNALSWSGVRVLLSVEKAATRERLLKDWLANDWTSVELNDAALQLDVGKQQKAAYRRKPQRRSLDDMLTQQLAVTQDWHSRYTQILAAPQHGLVAQIKKDPAAAEKVEKLAELAGQLRTMSTEARQLALSIEASIAKLT